MVYDLGGGWEGWPRSGRDAGGTRLHATPRNELARDVLREGRRGVTCDA